MAKKMSRQTVFSALTRLRACPVLRVVFSGNCCEKIRLGIGQAAKEKHVFLDDCPRGAVAEADRPMADGLLVVGETEAAGREAVTRLGKRMEALPTEMVCVGDAGLRGGNLAGCWRLDWAAAGVLLARHAQALQLPHVVCWQWRRAAEIWQGFDREVKRLGNMSVKHWSLEMEFPSCEMSAFSEDARTWLLQKLALLPRPAVVVAESDYLAYLVIMAAQRLHLRVPEHVAVVGVGDCELVQGKCPVSLSSVDMNWSRLGYLATCRLVDRLGGNGGGGMPLAVVPQRLVERASTQQFYSEDEAVAHIVQRIRRDFAEPLSVKILAREVGLSASLLHARYSAMTGSTIIKSLREIRLAAAAGMLRDGDWKLESIASETGLGDVRNLFRLFREHYGVTPTQYRNLHQHPEEELGTLLE